MSTEEITVKEQGGHTEWKHHESMTQDADIMKNHFQTYTRQPIKRNPKQQKQNTEWFQKYVDCVQTKLAQLKAKKSEK